MKTSGGFLITQIKHASGRVFEKLLRDSGIDVFNGAQGRILYVLWQAERLTISEIAKRTSLAKTTLTSMLDRLEEAGLVRREPDQTNRRQIFVSITDKARAYQQAYDDVSDHMGELYYKGFTESEIQQFEDTLRRILRNLESEGEST